MSRFTWMRLSVNNFGGQYEYIIWLRCNNTHTFTFAFLERADHLLKYHYPGTLLQVAIPSSPYQCSQTGSVPSECH